MRAAPLHSPSRSLHRGAAASWLELLVALLCLWAWTSPRPSHTDAPCPPKPTPEIHTRRASLPATAARRALR